MADETTHEIAPGVLRETLRGGHILAFTVATGQKRALDAFAQESIRIISSLREAERQLLLLDFGGAKLTGHAAKRTQDVLGQMPKGIAGRAALVLPGGVAGTAMRTFATKLMGGRFPHLTVGYFKGRDPALAWLAEVLN